VAEGAVIPAETVNEILEFVGYVEVDVFRKTGGIRARMFVFVVGVRRVGAVAIGMVFVDVIDKFHGGQIWHVEYTNDAVCTVHEHLPAVACQAEERYDA